MAGVITSTGTIMTSLTFVALYIIYTRSSLKCFFSFYFFWVIYYNAVFDTIAILLDKSCSYGSALVAYQEKKRKKKKRFSLLFLHVSIIFANI